MIQAKQSPWIILLKLIPQLNIYAKIEIKWIHWMGWYIQLKKKIQEFKANIMKISTYTCSNMYNCVATETCVTNTTSFDCYIPVYILVYMNIHVKSNMTINVKINLNKCFIQILCFYCLIKQISQNHLGIWCNIVFTNHS